MQNDSRNFIIFIAVTLVLLMVYEHFVIDPMQRRHQAEQAQAQAAAAAAQKEGVQLAPDGTPVVSHLTRFQALAATPRVALSTPALSGSISLRGARIDDLFLCGTDPKTPPCYRQTVANKSPPAELLRPAGAENAYYVVSGWTSSTLQGLPDETTNWTAASSGPLTPQHPLDLAYASPQGLVFHRRIAVDDSYLFTITDQVQNTGAVAVSLAPYGSVQRRGVPPDLGKAAAEGAIGMFDRQLKEVKYPKWKKDADAASGVSESDASTGGWLGITDKYWMTTFIPSQSEPINAQFRVRPVGGLDDYETAYVGAARVVAPGASITETTHLFSGVKVVEKLKAYGAQLGAPRFEDSVDWGWFQVLTKPLFIVLDFYARHLPNFGIAILALTVSIRVLLFPIFNASYAMSTKMKKVQPQLKVLQDKYKSEPQTLQKEMMALYQREKINPITGCIPALMPIPVFYALNNIFNVTIEMRHASFGWVRDLSAPDPTTVWNLFGLLPWDPLTSGWTMAIMNLPFLGGLAAMIFHLGAWPIMYAVTMWLSLLTGPTMTGIDPTQAKMMKWMPWVFMFILARSTVGLVIYWSFSSVFTLVQQYVLMRRFKVDNPIDQFFARLSAPKAPTAAG